MMRWHIKKATRHGIVLMSWASGYTALERRLGRGPRVRALTYHRFRPCNRDPFSVDVERFAGQMQWLAEQGLAISLADLEDFLAGRRQVRDGSVLVTIDDGYQEIWSLARPILKEYGIPAVAFVSSAEVRPSGAPAPPDSVDDGPRLSPSEVTALPGDSVAIGSHSWQHRSLGRMSAQDAQRQVNKSKQDLEALLNRPVTAFAYPFGTRQDYNATTASLLAEAGYALGFTSQHGAIDVLANPYSLPRIKVEGGEALWMFKLLVSGALDSWGLIDRWFWRLQASGGVQTQS